MNDMQGEIKQLEAELRSLDEIVNKTKVLSNKAKYLVGELDRFDKAYLSPDL